MEPQTQQPQPAKYTNISDESAIRQLMEDVSEAVQERDIETILAAYSNDAVIFDVRDSLKIDKSGLRKSWQECFDTSKEFSYKIKDLKFEIDQDIAFSFCLSHSTGLTNDNNKIDVWLRVTTCYAKENEKWVVIHEHTSVPGDFMTGKILQDLKPEAPTQPN